MGRRKKRATSLVVADELLQVDVTLQELGKQSKPEPLLNESCGVTNGDKPLGLCRCSFSHTEVWPCRSHDEGGIRKTDICGIGNIQRERRHMVPKGGLDQRLAKRDDPSWIAGAGRGVAKCPLSPIVGFGKQAGGFDLARI